MTNRLQRRVLAADADLSALRHFEACLEGEPFAVVTAVHGREAIRALKEDPSFCAAVISLDLPGISGLDLLKRARADSRLSHVPVVMTVEADGDPRSRVDCLSAGAVSCLPKPFAKGQLLSILRLTSGRRLAGPPPAMTAGVGGGGYVAVYDGLGPATGHALLNATTTLCGRRVERGRGVEYSRERPPGTRACHFCHG